MLQNELPAQQTKDSLVIRPSCCCNPRVRRAFILLLPLIALAFCVPWMFSETTHARPFGVPVWAAVSLGAAALYAALVAFLTGRFWELAAAGDDNDDEPDRG